MEYQTIANPDGTISIVPINQQQGIMVPAYETSQLDLVNQINQGPRNIGAPMTLEETMAGSVLPPDPRRFQSIFPTTGIMQQAPLQNLGIDTSYGVANEEDVEQVDSLTGEKKSGGIMDLIMSIAIPGYGFLKNIASNFKQDPRATGIRNFYSPEGLTSTGSIASGIMKGYNPISGGFLNKITRGKFGRPTQYGLADAARRRIDRIANRKAAQTDASRAKIKKLQDFARADTISRARQAAPDVYASADKQGFTDSSGGFKSAGTNENFSNKTGRGRTGY